MRMIPKIIIIRKVQKLAKILRIPNLLEFSKLLFGKNLKFPKILSFFHKSSFRSVFWSLSAKKSCLDKIKEQVGPKLYLIRRTWPLFRGYTLICTYADSLSLSWLHGNISVTVLAMHHSLLFKKNPTRVQKGTPSDFHFQINKNQPINLCLVSFKFHGLLAPSSLGPSPSPATVSPPTWVVFLSYDNSWSGVYDQSAKRRNISLWSPLTPDSLRLIIRVVPR